jgi:hypothetical protein
MKPEVTSFYERYAWKSLRYHVLKKLGAKCLLCGRGRDSEVSIHVDHIKPVSIYPELALTEDNLQVLCADCNQGKSNKDIQDFRPKLKVVKSAGPSEITDLVELVAARLKQDAIRASDAQNDSKSAAALRMLLEYRRALSQAGHSRSTQVSIAQKFNQELVNIESLVKGGETL